MRSKGERTALLTIRENIWLARSFTAGLTAGQFAGDRKTIYAVTRCLEIISEASRRLGDDLLSRHPEVPWHQIRGAGNIYRHEYDNVSPQFLWNTIENALDDLDRAVAAEVDPDNADDRHSP